MSDSRIAANPGWPLIQPRATSGIAVARNERLRSVGEFSVGCGRPLIQLAIALIGFMVFTGQAPIRASDELHRCAHDGLRTGWELTEQGLQGGMVRRLIHK